MSPEKRGGLVLLTSAFLESGEESEHVAEIYSAIALNLLNKFIAEVHILTENDCHAVLRRLQHQVARMPGDWQPKMKASIDAKLGCTSTPGGRQPSYADFFGHANRTMKHRVVLLFNGDVVLDESLGLIDPLPIMTHSHAFVLSVQPPPSNGFYKEVFNRECDNTPRCVVGAWNHGGDWGQSVGSGSSWDGYVFAPPLPGTMHLGHIDLFMNFNGAESLAGFQLEANSNLTLYNPCYHVHAYHWHCQGGKTHSRDPMVRADTPLWYTKMLHLPPHWPHDAVMDIFPCWSCPGVDRPKGAVGPSGYCQAGTLFGLEEAPYLEGSFRTPLIEAGICCKNPATCSHLPVNELPHCEIATDVDCVTWESTENHTYY
jgi:hypothetical protein